MAIITEEEGDIFNAPPNSFLLHACNAQSVWGKGVALAFKKKFPKASQEYRLECDTKPPYIPSLAAHRKSLVGTFTITFIDHTSVPSLAPDEFYYIVSLITSEGYGKNLSDPMTILYNTSEAIRVLKPTTDHFKEQFPTRELKVYAVKINSGLFNVPWDATKRVLEGGEIDMTILIPPSSINQVNNLLGEMTELAGPRPQKKRRRNVSQSPPPSKPSPRKKRVLEGGEDDVTILKPPSSPDQTKQADEGSTELVGPGPQKKRRRSVSQSLPLSKPASRKKRNTAKAPVQPAPAVEIIEPIAQEQKNADRDARHTQRAALKGSPRRGWED